MRFNPSDQITTLHNSRPSYAQSSDPADHSQYTVTPIPALLLILKWSGSIKVTSIITTNALVIDEGEPSGKSRAQGGPAIQTRVSAGVSYWAGHAALSL
jgi:hypothetical protein